MKLLQSGLLGRIFGPPPGTPDGYVATAKASKSDGFDWEAAAGGAPTGAAGGDLGGSYPNPTVAKALAALTDVTLTSPQEGDLLEYTSGKWRNAAGALVKVLSATWSPADVTLDETATPVTIPAHALYLGLSMRIATPTDAGSTPTFGIADATDYIPAANNGGIALKSDGYFPTAHEDIVANYSASAIAGAFSVQADDPITLSYTAGLTPGATKPVVKFVLVYIPGVF